MSEERAESRRAGREKYAERAARRRNKIINNTMTVIILLLSAAVIAAFILNMIRVRRQSTVANEGTESELVADMDNSMKNDLYRIGNNPTEVEKEYFQKLTDTLKSGTKEEQAEAVVYAFVSDFFTWTNKDGNYEVGGQQYIYGPKYTSFESWALSDYYRDLDLYISQYGRENLPQVKEVMTDAETFKTDDFEVVTSDPHVTMDCYQVQVKWTYDSNAKVDLANFPDHVRFQVVDNNGRMEIAEFYDMPSVIAWEAANS